MGKFNHGMLTLVSTVFFGSLPVTTAGCQNDDSGTTSTSPAQVVRKSASQMTSDEIDRFQRAFGYAVSSGKFDDFSYEHSRGDFHRMHGAEVMPNTPLMVMLMTTTHGYRLLPWHRTFIMEVEAMLQDALAERDTLHPEEGHDPSEAKLLFVPYWDATHDQALPAWVLAFQPTGGTAIAPTDLPEGHAGYGHEGQRYNIVFGRWPGTNPGFATLPKPDQIGRILAHDNFPDFYRALDLAPEIEPPTTAQMNDWRARLPGNGPLDTILDALSATVLDNEDAIALLNAVNQLSYESAEEETQPGPKPTSQVLEELMTHIQFPPHARYHLWAGGLDPAHPEVRGTVTYFHELAVDPVFWMLHAELDRTWYTWQETHPEAPPLTGDDAKFQPMSAAEGAPYDGGKAYDLATINDRSKLSYRYDKLFAE